MESTASLRTEKSMNESVCAMDYVRSSVLWLNVRKEIPKSFVQTNDRILDNILGCEALLFCSLHVVVFNNGKWVVNRLRREDSLFFVNTTPQVAFVQLINHCNEYNIALPCLLNVCFSCVFHP